MSSQYNEIVNNIPFLVLASLSPRRKELLQELGISFEIKAATIDESSKREESALVCAKRLAREKAQYICNKITPNDKSIVVLGADTLICFENRILGKPKNSKEAHKFLNLLSGKTHEVITGYCLIKIPNQIICHSATLSKVTMQLLSERQITEYIQTGEPLDKAGAYAIQEMGGQFIDHVEGSINNVIGLPTEDLVPWFKKLGILKS